MRLHLLPILGLSSAILCSSMVGCGSTPPAVAPKRRGSRSCIPSSGNFPTTKSSTAGWRPTSRSKFAPACEGISRKVNFTDGQYVKKGDLLFELDPRPFQAEIGKASDSLKVFEAQKTAAG